MTLAARNRAGPAAVTEGVLGVPTRYVASV